MTLSSLTMALRSASGHVHVGFHQRVSKAVKRRRIPPGPVRALWVNVVSLAVQRAQLGDWDRLAQRLGRLSHERSTVATIHHQKVGTPTRGARSRGIEPPLPTMAVWS